MAAATAVQGAATIGLGAAKFFSNRAKEKRAENFIRNFRWQDLQNPFEKEQVSTLGADLRKEEAGRNTATAINALSKGGARTLLGGIGKVQQNNNNVNAEIAANLDQQQAGINTRIAQQEAIQQGMIEKRQADELAGYGQMLNVAQQNKWQGLTDIVNGIGTAGAGMSGMSFGGGATPANAGMTAQGITPLSGGATIQNSSTPFQLPAGWRQGN